MSKDDEYITRAEAQTMVDAAIDRLTTSILLSVLILAGFYFVPVVTVTLIATAVVLFLGYRAFKTIGRLFGGEQHDDPEDVKYRVRLPLLPPLPVPPGAKSLWRRQRKLRNRR